MSYPTHTEAVSHPLLDGITDKRLGLFTNGHFESQNLSSVLEWDRVGLSHIDDWGTRERADSKEKQKERDDDAVQLWVWSAPGKSKPSFDEATKQLDLQSLATSSEESMRSRGLKRYELGTALGPSWTNHWVWVNLKIPKEWAATGEPVICQCCFYLRYEDDVPIV
jgi:alpha-mannosidase